MYERQFKFVVDYDYLIKNYTYMYNYIYVKNVCYKVLLHLYTYILHKCLTHTITLMHRYMRRMK